MYLIDSNTFSNQALLTVSLDPITLQPRITNKDAICEGLKPSIKVRAGNMELVARGRKGHSPRDWIRLKEERRKVDVGIGQQVRKRNYSLVELFFFA